MKKFIALTLSLILGLQSTALSASSNAQQTLKELRNSTKEKAPKLAPDLEEMLAQDDEEQRVALTGKTLAQVRQERLANRLSSIATDEQIERTRINGLLMPSTEVLPEEKQSFIVQMSSTAANAVLKEKVARLGGNVRESLNGMGMMMIEAPRTVIRQLAAESSIAYVSPDRPIASTGHLENTTGASLVRTMISGQTLDGSNGGNNIAVAILDSGFDQNHNLLRSSNNHPGIVTQIDCTNTGQNLDAYGHGSHVGSIVMGSSVVKSGAYQGIAPAAKIINVTVLDTDGRGTASNVIKGLDWCVSNKTNSNIRVINLSLGTPAKDSYKTDPLCLAARRAHNAGIVVVASAGNNGKDSTGKKVYGAINSPGIDPSVSTVGAVTSHGKVWHRSDDTIAMGRPRGPTRGYTTTNGVRKYDNLIKPDIVAPGNKIIAARSNNYNNNGNKITAAYPALLAGTTVVQDTVMYMSGTSMAASS